MVKTSHRIAAAFAMLFVMTGLAFGEELSCPPTVSVRESLEQSPSEPWVARPDTSVRYLSGAGFFAGDPKDDGSLAPDRDFPGKGKDRVALWQFGADGVPIWLACRYSDTRTLLFRRLPQYKECRVTYGPAARVKAIDCK